MIINSHSTEDSNTIDNAPLPLGREITDTGFRFQTDRLKSAMRIKKPAKIGKNVVGAVGIEPTTSPV